MDLRGDALRADVRRICSLAYVMPPAFAVEPERPKAKITDAAALRRREACRKGERRRQKEAMSDRPPNCMTKPEVARMLGLSLKWIEAKVRRRGLQPVRRNVFAWYSIEDLQRAGII